MARINNLTNFLTDVASAIKTKRGYTSSQKIEAEDFDTEINNIQTGTDTSDATATANDIMSSKTAYVDGIKLTGTITNNGVLNYTPTENTQTIPTGYTSGGTVSAITSSVDYQNCLTLSNAILE